KTKARRKRRGPFVREPCGAGRIPLQQRVADIAVARAREGDQTLSDLREPLAPPLAAAAMLIADVGAREPIAELQITIARRGEQQRAKGRIAFRIVRNPDIA